MKGPAYIVKGERHESYLTSFRIDAVKQNENINYLGERGRIQTIGNVREVKVSSRMLYKFIHYLNYMTL